jgi:hypothetical protein
MPASQLRSLVMKKLSGVINVPTPRGARQG